MTLNSNNIDQEKRAIQKNLWNYSDENSEYNGTIS